MTQLTKAALLLLFVFVAWGNSQATASTSHEGVDLAYTLPGDGHRYVAFKRPDGVPVVFDTRDQVVREISGADGCWPTLVGGGRVFLQCGFQTFPGDQNVEPSRFASVRGGVSIPVPGFDPDLRYQEIGMYWMRVSWACQGGQCGEPPMIYASTRTGKRRVLENKGFDSRDLNSRNLAPVRSPGFIGEIPRKHGNIVCYNRDAAVTETRGILRLWRSGSRSIVLGSQPAAGADCFESRALWLSSGRLTWARGKSIHAINVKTFRKLSLRTATHHPSVAPVKDGIVTAIRRKGSKIFQVKFIHLK